MNDLARVILEHMDEVAVARVTGEIDLSNAEQVSQQVLEAAVGGSCRAVAVDLSETTYLDSAGIRGLFEVAERLRAIGCAFRCVVPADSPLRRVLKLAEAERTLDLDETLDEALAALS